MTFQPDKDTLLCMSLAARPGNFGTRFHNYLYRQLGLNYFYKAFTTQDLHAAINGIRALGIRGCAVSMPFKEACIPFLDELAPSAAAIQSVNTIVNTDGHLKAFNTDYLAIRHLIERHAIPADVHFALQGSGGMAKAVAFALKDAGFSRGTIIARNLQAGPALAQACGYDWQPELGGLRPEWLINVTPIGMEGGPEACELAFAQEAIEAAEAVFDVVAKPVQTPLIQLAQRLGKPVITGLEVIALQALEQFVLYTGVRPAPEQVREAIAFAAQA